jgi:flagellar motor switch protein FliN/FliY
MSDEKDLNETNQKSETEPEIKTEEKEDDDISWDDAFKEQAAADEAVKSSKTQDQDETALDIDIDDIKSGVNSKSTVKDTDEAETDAQEISVGIGAKTVKKPVKKLEFAAFDESDKTSEPPKNLDFILDIPLTISVELGRTKMVINDMLQLGQGSVIELAKLAGEPLDIYVNGKLMARGEVVLVNDKFGVRLTDIISPVERVKKL